MTKTAIHGSVTLRHMRADATALGGLLEQLRVSTLAHEVAYRHNYLFEERVSTPRQEAYESALALAAGAGMPGWREQHMKYLEELVRDPHRADPETFTELNQVALVPGLDEQQEFLRMEGIDRPLTEQGLDLAQLAEQLEAFRGSDAGRHDRARAFLEEFCLRWCEKLDGRPSFVCFADELAGEIDAPDWAERFRDRLGLSQYDPAPGTMLPVALMRYRVREVLRVHSREARLCFSVPTCLDGPLSAHFFPSPGAVPYGRTLDLTEDTECERLVSEILHRRFDYRPEHLLKVGFIRRATPRLPLARLRNQHLFCLRYHSGKDAFGEEMADGLDG